MGLLGYEAIMLLGYEAIGLLGYEAISLWSYWLLSAQLNRGCAQFKTHGSPMWGQSKKRGSENKICPGSADQY